MRTLLSVLLGGSLAACQAAEQPGGAGSAENDPAVAATETSTAGQAEPAADPDPAAPPSLEGEYRVAGIDGEPLNADFGIALTITADRISYAPVCAGHLWNYTYEGGILHTERATERQPDGTVVVCAIAVAPEQRQLGEALDAVTTARRTPSNALELSGEGRSVTLYSQ